MIPETPPSAAPKKAVTPRHALLENLISLVNKHIGEQFSELSTNWAARLVDVTDASNVKDMQARLRSGNLLRTDHYALLGLFAKQLESDLRHEIAQLAPGQKTQVRKTAEPLSLVSMEEMDSKVTMGSFSKAFETKYSDALATLNVRLAFLLDRDILRINQNPFRPEVFLGAFQQAWMDFVKDEESNELVKPFLKPDDFFDFAPMLEELNLALERKGVGPGSVEKHKSRRADSHDASQAPNRKKNQQAALAEQLRNFFAGAGDAPGGKPAPTGFDQLGDLDLSLPTMNVAPGLYGTPAHTAAASALGAGAAPAMGAAAPVAAAPGFPAQGMPMMAPGAVPMPMPMMAGGGAALPPAAGVMSGMPLMSGGAMPAGAAMGGAMLTGVAVPGVPGGVAVPPGGWTQGPAQGFNGGANNEAAQRASLLSAKEPLLNFLAQLQRAVPQGAVFAGAEGGAMPAGGFVTGAPMGGAQVAGHAGGGQGMPAPGSIPAGASMAAPGFAAGGAMGNVFLLPQIKEQAPAGSLTRADEGTIDLLSAVFDTVFRDQSISPEIRDLIRFLQIPVLKAALVDKNFFFQEAHPARRMIDLLSRMGWEQHKDPDDPLYQAMQRSVEKVSKDHEEEISVFTEAVNELEASIKAEEAAAAAAMAEPIAKALKQEKMSVAAKSAKDAVALRIGTGEVVAIVEAFLENKWVSVLTIAYSVEDEKPGAVNNATQTMDDLIWSVRPKITQDDRRKLISKLPSLLSTLNKWLDVIKWQDSDRLQFFAELAECHASIVRAPIEMSPERQVEIALEVAQKDAERRLQLQALAESEAEVPPQEDDDASIEVDSLARGMWLEFDEDDGSKRKVKLAWISPLKTLYIFSTTGRQEAFSISGEAMAQHFREGKVRLIRTEGVVAAALSVAMGGVAAVNDEHHDLPANGTSA
ncbi:DUF1631 family protein [Pseudoduganella sp. DS3]|uniref:DUF1631 family protein n=1 Tax=Pseudoduganella guangdongensis TaxID=2692179 RepID=A0A6N9HMP8_9BURK|nr:DUF1631 family protein [Pseudoduganella guangdongensis]MYN03975.1 DUF1631 family protein [Pseudoduganella guangdongensis]